MQEANAASGKVLLAVFDAAEAVFPAAILLEAADHQAAGSRAGRQRWNAASTTSCASNGGRGLGGHHG